MAPPGAAQYEEVFDEGHSGKDHSIHARMRANSTIMDHTKILVANRGEIPIRVQSPLTGMYGHY